MPQHPPTRSFSIKRVAAGLVAALALLLVINTILWLVGDLLGLGSPIEAAYQEALAHGDWDRSNLVFVGSDDKSNLIYRTAVVHFRVNHDESPGEIRVELVKPLHFAGWRFRGYSFQRALTNQRQ